MGIEMIALPSSLQETTDCNDKAEILPLDILLSIRLVLLMTCFTLINTWNWGSWCNERVVEVVVVVVVVVESSVKWCICKCTIWGVTMQVELSVVINMCGYHCCFISLCRSVTQQMCLLLVQMDSPDHSYDLRKLNDGQDQHYLPLMVDLGHFSKGRFTSNMERSWITKLR